MAQLAQLCADVGMSELTDQALCNLEEGRADKRGRRGRATTLDELRALALVLDVAPVHLLIPDDDDVPYPGPGWPSGRAWPPGGGSSSP